MALATAQGIRHAAQAGQQADGPMPVEMPTNVVQMLRIMGQLTSYIRMLGGDDSNNDLHTDFLWRPISSGLQQPMTPPPRRHHTTTNITTTTPPLGPPRLQKCPHEGPNMFRCKERLI